MSRAPKEIFTEIFPLSVGGLVQQLKDKGVVRLDNLLSIEQVRSLLACVNNQLSKSIEQVSDKNAQNQFFANSKAQNYRWDLKLQVDEVVRSSMAALLRPGSLLADTLEQMIGDASITELAAFVTTQGADRQIVHSDTVWSKAPSSFTCMIALQDVDETMGPTVFIPFTHTEEVYLERVTEFMELGAECDSAQLQKPHTLSTLNSGSAALYDSRLLHCGGANRSERARVLFYFSVSTSLLDDDELFDSEAVAEQKTNDFDKSIRQENAGYKLSSFLASCTE